MPQESYIKKAVLFCFVQTENESNGGVISLINIGQSLVNFTPIFLSQVRTKRTDMLVKKGFTVVYIERINWKSPLLKPFSVLFWNITVMRVIMRYKISVLHANDNQMVWRTIFAAKLLRKKFVSNIRGLFEPNVTYGLSRLWVNCCDNIIVLSDEMRTELKKRLPFVNRMKAQKHIRVIGSIINSDFFRKPKCLPGKGTDQFRGKVLIVAAFNSLKNQLTFLKETALWFKERNICVHFLGDYDPMRNEYARNCEQVVHDLGVSSHIYFHGFKADIHDAYRMADLTLVVSRREGLARCMIESLACGTPVISFDVCSAYEILIRNDCGVVVKQGDYKQLCMAVSSLLEEPGKMNQMSLNAIATARRLFTEEEIVRQYEEVYER